MNFVRLTNYKEPWIKFGLDNHKIVLIAEQSLECIDICTRKTHALYAIYTQIPSCCTVVPVLTCSTEYLLCTKETLSLNELHLESNFFHKWSALLMIGSAENPSA